jgi:hypothetical protein
MSPLSLDKAREIFGLGDSPTREALDARRRELLALWHPHRYASLTNNPRKYMQMYTKGEAMTREINEAYAQLVAWLEARATRG